MKKFSKFLMLIVSLIVIGSTMIGCSYSNVEAGYVGIKVYKMGNAKGVNQEVVGVGRYWLTINEDLYQYPVFIQLYRFTQGKDNGDDVGDEAFYFSNKDGVQCNVDIAIQAQAVPEQAATLFQKYRSQFEDIVKKNLRSQINSKIQNYASALSVEELYSPKKIEMMKKVEEDLRKDCAPLGINIVSVTLLSNIRFPEAVENSITAKIKMTQQALESQNGVIKAKADAQIQIANARGIAESNRLLQVSLTPMLLQKMAIEKWDGALPTYMVSGATTPFITIPNAK